MTPDEYQIRLETESSMDDILEAWRKSLKEYGEVMRLVSSSIRKFTRTFTYKNNHKKHLIWRKSKRDARLKKDILDK